MQIFFRYKADKNTSHLKKSLSLNFNGSYKYANSIKAFVRTKHKYLKKNEKSKKKFKIML